MQDLLKDEFLEKLNRCPLFSDAFGPSLQQRINKPNWFENRFIQDIIRDASWMKEHERLLTEAKIKEVKNWDKIFTQLNGDAPDYDLKIFDVLAEVRLIRWARENGYIDIEKLTAGRQSTPDFLMKKEGEVTIAEAKHFRGIDYIPDFVEDRIKGLVWKTRYLTRFGISIETTDKYKQMREFLLKTRLRCERGYQEVIRDELTEEWLRKLECSLAKDTNLESEIFLGLFGVRRSQIPGAAVLLFGPPKNQNDATKLMLEKLCGDLIKALKQIKSFIDTNPSREIPSRALVFLSGGDEWNAEWNDMWETLECQDGIVWEDMKRIHNKAHQLIKLPFELIVGKYKKERGMVADRRAIIRTLEYVPFSWTPEISKGEGTR